MIYGQGGGHYGKVDRGRGGGRLLRYVVMADIADVETWYGEGNEIGRVRTGVWLRSGGESKGSI